MYFGQKFFAAKYWEADYFGRVGVAGPSGIDPWFPGRGHGEITWEPRKVEEKPKKKKRHRHPLRVPKALLPVIELPPPLELPPLVEPVPQPELRPVPQVQAEDLQSAPLAMAPPPEPQGAHWTEYQHIPYTAADEAEELQAILAAVLRRR